MSKQTIDLGEYKIIIDHGEDGYLEVMVQDELGEDIEGITISNRTDDDDVDDE